MQVVQLQWPSVSRLSEQNTSFHSFFSNGQAGINAHRCGASAGLQQSKIPAAATLCKPVCGYLDRLHLASLISTITISSQGNGFYSSIICLGFDDDVYISNLLISMYGRCGELLDACAVFDSMVTPNVVSWTSLITCFLNNGDSNTAVQIFKEMIIAGTEPNRVTFLAVLSACMNIRSLQEGRTAHACAVESGVELDIAIGASLVNFYEKCNLLEETCIVFDKMCLRNVVVWASMIAAYARLCRYEEAVLLFWHMQNDGVEPNEITFVNVLSACAGNRDLLSGRLIHTLVIITGFDTNIEIGTSLLTMYGKCGKVLDAASSFRSLQSQNIISWTSMMTIYKEHEKHQDCLLLYKRMFLEGYKPDKITFIIALNACAGISSFSEGMRVHMFISCLGLETDVLVTSALIDMYAKVGSFLEASSLFNKAHQRDAVLWSAMISGCILNGNKGNGLQLFEQMLQEGVVPDELAYTSVLGACCNPEDLSHGRIIHSQFTDAGLSLDIVGGSLISMYANCGEVDEAIRVFHAMESPNAVASNAVISACVQHGIHEKALELFYDSWQRSHELDEITFIHSLSACAGLSALQEGRKIHALLIETGYLDSAVENAVINFYSKCGSLKDLHVIFGKTSLPSILSWTAFITAYAQHGLGKEALFVLYRMQKEGFVPDGVVLLSVLSSFSHAGMVDDAVDILLLLCSSHKVKLTVDHIVVIIDLFGRAGRLTEAECYLSSFPLEITSAYLSSLLNSSLIHDDIRLGRTAATNMLDDNSFVTIS